MLNTILYLLAKSVIRLSELSKILELVIIVHMAVVRILGRNKIIPVTHIFVNNVPVIEQDNVMAAATKNEHISIERQNNKRCPPSIARYFDIILHINKDEMAGTNIAIVIHVITAANIVRNIHFLVCGNE